MLLQHESDILQRGNRIFILNAELLKRNFGKNEESKFLSAAWKFQNETCKHLNIIIKSNRTMAFIFWLWIELLGFNTFVLLQSSGFAGFKWLPIFIWKFYYLVFISSCSHDNTAHKVEYSKVWKQYLDLKKLQARTNFQFFWHLIKFRPDVSFYRQRRSATLPACSFNLLSWHNHWIYYFLCWRFRQSFNAKSSTSLPINIMFCLYENA